MFLMSDLVKMIILLCSYLLLQTAVDAEECPIHCRQSTSLGDSCCECNNRLFTACRRQCWISYDTCYVCLNNYRESLTYFKSKCFGCHEYEHFPTGECRPCPKGCVSCFDQKYCFECKKGLYGRSCNKSCAHCLPDDNGKDACDINTGICLNNCIAGYFGPSCFDKCNSNCFDSNTNTNRCDKLSGNCIYGCVSGWYGGMCNKTCSNTCQNRSCRQKSGDCEERCLSGWYGGTCDITCSNTCSERSCSQKSGFCKNGCVSGWYGDTCNITCSNMCSERSCSQNSGYCENGCVSGWYGDTCNVSCSSNCNGTSCDQNLGQCDDGCLPGFYGHTCEFNCVDTCKNGVCDMETSVCFQGCVTGYEGSFCNTTTHTGHDSILVGITGSLAGVLTSLAFAFIVWCIKRKIIKEKRYNSLQMSTRENNAVSVYDEILDINDTTQEHRVSGHHLYMEVGTAHTPTSIHESEPNTRNSCDTEIAGNCALKLAVVESINDSPLVNASALSMTTLHSEVSKYNNSDEIHTYSFISLDNAEARRKCSNRSRKYYEINDIIPDHDHRTSDGYETPISGSTAENAAEAEGASVSSKCSTSHSKKTQNKDLMSTRNKEINVNDINQTQKAKEDKCNSSSSGFDIDIPLETHQTQENVTDGDSDSLNYIHPVN